MIPIDVDRYLKRIQAKREVLSIRYLKSLHHSHLTSIPFENLDIHYNRKIELDYQKIFHKIVVQRRGGFCYELNGLFLHLLFHLGFESYPVSVRVYDQKRKAYGKEYDHLALIVELDGHKWLVDVGFGDGFIYPKKIVINEPQIDYTTYWKIEQDPDENFILKKSADNAAYYSIYQFSMVERQLIEFIHMCDHHQTSQDSSFTQKKFITQLTPEGRITLTDRELKVLQLGEQKSTDILNEDEFLAKLNEHFGISFRQLINADAF
jgi:N-hydroxyarylamine O-acetyltransferase